MHDLMNPPDGRQSQVCLGTQPWVWHSGGMLSQRYGGMLPNFHVGRLSCSRRHAASSEPRRGFVGRRHAASREPRRGFVGRRLVIQPGVRRVRNLMNPPDDRQSQVCLGTQPWVWHSGACCPSVMVACCPIFTPGVCQSEACCLKRTPPGGCRSEACCLVSQPGVRRVRDLMNLPDGRQSQLCLGIQPWVWHSGACCPSVMVACCPFFTPGVCQSEACCLKRTPPGVCQSEACCLVTQPGVRRVRDLMTPPDGHQSEVCLGTQPWVWHSGACCPSVMVACCPISPPGVYVGNQPGWWAHSRQLAFVFFLAVWRGGPEGIQD